jgi:hypothetical protein
VLGKLTVTVEPNDIALYTAVYAFGVPVPVEDVVEFDEEAELPHPRARVAQEAAAARMRER